MNGQSITSNFKIKTSKTSEQSNEKHNRLFSPDEKSKLHSRESTYETLPEYNTDRPKKNILIEIPTVKKSLNNLKLTPLTSSNQTSSYDFFASQKQLIKPSALSPSILQNDKSIQKTERRRINNETFRNFKSLIDKPLQITPMKIFRIKDKFLDFKNSPAQNLKLLGFGTQNPQIKINKQQFSVDEIGAKKEAILSKNLKCICIFKNGSNFVQNESENLFLKTQLVKFEGFQHLENSFFLNSKLLDSLAKFRDSDNFKSNPFVNSAMVNSDFNSDGSSVQIKSLNSFLDLDKISPDQEFLKQTPSHVTEKEEMNKFFQAMENELKTDDFEKYFSGTKTEQVGINVEQVSPTFSNFQSVSELKKNLNIKNEFNDLFFNLNSFPKNGIEKRKTNTTLLKTNQNNQIIKAQKSDDLQVFMESDKDLKYASFKFIDLEKEKEDNSSFYINQSEKSKNIFHLNCSELVVEAVNPFKITI